VDGNRLFSLREANGLVAMLQREFSRARVLRDRLAAIQERLVAAGRPLEGPELQVDASASSEVQGLQAEAVEILGELRGLLRELSDLGLEVKAADGLVDLRSKLHGRVVYLCWKFGEERVGHYHELDAGFAGRQPLPEGGDFLGDLLH
jgi:hypothetical protein